MLQRYHQIWLAPDAKSTMDVYWNIDDYAVAGYTGPGTGWSLISNTIESYSPNYAASQQPVPQGATIPSLQPLVAPVAPPAVAGGGILPAAPNTPLPTLPGGVSAPPIPSVNGSNPTAGNNVIPAGMAAQFNWRMFIHSPLTIGALIIVIIVVLVTRKGGF